jgi:phosphonate transport system substrate-binding protein
MFERQYRMEMSTMGLKNSFKLLGLGAALLSTVVMGGGAAIAQDATPAPVKTYDKTDWPSELNCGLFGGDDAEGALRDNEPLADYLSNYLGIPMEYTVGTSYNAVIESMRAGHTNCGTVGPFSYILAVQEAGAEAVAVEVYANDENPVYDPTLRPAYFSVISVKKGSGIDSLDDLKGKTFSFVDPASTSGFLIPSSEFHAVGIDPENDMTTIFAGSHPTSAIALWNDKVDGAASTETTLVNLAKEGQIDYCGFADGKTGVDRTPEEIKAVYDACPDGSIVAIAYSSPIPNTPFAVKSDLPESLKQAIKDALLDIRNHPDLIAQTKTWYIDPNIEYNLGLPHLDNYYDPLREVAKQLDLDLKSFGS